MVRHSSFSSQISGSPSSLTPNSYLQWFRQQHLGPTPFLREQLQRQNAIRPPVTPATASMQSRMHQQSNASERPANQNGYRTITDGLGPILLGANRRDNFYSDISFHQGFIPSVDFSNSMFSILMDFRHSNASHANFTDSELSSARFGHAILNGARFDGAYLGKASFEGAKLGRVNKILPLFLPIHNETGGLFNRLFPLLTPRLSQPQAQPATFRKAYLPGANFKSAEAEGCDFRDADLSFADVEDANLKDADLRGARLTGVQLEKAKNVEGAKIDITRCIEDELQADNPQVAKLVITLAHLSATRGLNLGLDDERLTDALRAIFPARQPANQETSDTDAKQKAEADSKKEIKDEKPAIHQQQPTQQELEAHFRHYYKKAERLVHYREMQPDEYLPYVFRQIQHKLAHPEIQSEESEPE